GAMLQLICDLRRLALRVEQRDTLPHGCHEGFVGPLELLGFALGVGLAAAFLWGVAEHSSQAAIRSACSTRGNRVGARNHIPEGAVLPLNQAVKVALTLRKRCRDFPHALADGAFIE